LGNKKYQDDLHYQASMVESSYTIGVIKGEKKKAMEIAKNLLDVLDAKTIAVKTGLTKEEIFALKQ